MKLWDEREFKDLDDDVKLGTRNIKIALRRLRKFARTGAPDEPQRRPGQRAQGLSRHPDAPKAQNAAKLLLFFDIGGSMDWHIKAAEELFSAARSEFKHMEHLSSTIACTKICGRKTSRAPQDNADLGRAAHLSARLQVISSAMPRCRLTRSHPQGRSVEHFNDEPGAVWLERVTRTYAPAAVLAQSRAREGMGLDLFDPDGAAVNGRSRMYALEQARPHNNGGGKRSPSYFSVSLARIIHCAGSMPTSEIGSNKTSRPSLANLASTSKAARARCIQILCAAWRR